ncbi:MAG: farnesyl diphosphate synthase [Paraperlucidibaca sp.]
MPSTTNAAPLPELLSQSHARFTPLLQGFLLRHHGPDDTLNTAIAYAMANGGKRVRPALAWGACLAVGGCWQAAESAALAVECIHGYSLVHDDLPCMDDDDLRRGQPSCHRQFDEATALLAGDALQALAFCALSDALANTPQAGAAHDAAAAVTVAKQTHALSRAARDMVYGQRLDLAAEGHVISVDALSQIHRYKTGALIRAAVRLGALAGAATDSQLAVLDQYADALGLAFQVHDDVLDVIGDTATLGKQSGADASHAKATYPALLGLAPAQALAQQLTDDALAALAPLGKPAEPLQHLAHYLLARDH